MTEPSDIHTCSYYCDRPACIKAQRDAFREQLEARQDANEQPAVPLPEPDKPGDKGSPYPAQRKSYWGEASVIAYGEACAAHWREGARCWQSIAEGEAELHAITKDELAETARERDEQRARAEAAEAKLAEMEAKR